MWTEDHRGSIWDFYQWLWWELGYIHFAVCRYHVCVTRLWTEDGGMISGSTAKSSAPFLTGWTRKVLGAGIFFWQEGNQPVVTVSILVSSIKLLEEKIPQKASDQRWNPLPPIKSKMEALVVLLGVRIVVTAPFGKRNWRSDPDLRYRGRDVDVCIGEWVYFFTPFLRLDFETISAIVSIMMPLSIKRWALDSLA